MLLVPVLALASTSALTSAMAVMLFLNVDAVDKTLNDDAGSDGDDADALLQKLGLEGFDFVGVRVLILALSASSWDSFSGGGKEPWVWEGVFVVMVDVMLVG